MAFDSAAPARAFVGARRSGAGLSDYPGPHPTDMAQAYQVQDAAIALHGDALAGWKIGRIGQDVERWGADRLAGPVFRRKLWTADDTAAAHPPVFRDGFAAVEAEFVLRIGRDADPSRTEWTREDAAAMVSEMRLGMEIASSPLPSINDHGPAVTASDFGNNNGLILGAEIADWRERDEADLPCETLIDDQVVGRGTAASIPGGPVGALAFLLGLCARRGRPLTEGLWITTGAATGVHPIRLGQSAAVRFPGYGEIRCTPVAAQDETHGRPNGRTPG